MSLTANDRGEMAGMIFRLREEVLRRMYQFERDYVARPDGKAKEAIVGLDQGVEACVGSLVEMEGVVEELQGRVDKLEAGMAGMLGKVVSLSSRVTQCEARLTQLEAKP